LLYIGLKSLWLVGGAVDDDGAKSAYGSCSAVSSTAAVDDADARRAAPTGRRRTELSLAKGSITDHGEARTVVG